MSSVQEVPMLCKRLFGLEVDFYDVLELLPIILKKTGGIATKYFLYKGKVKDYKLELPCNVHGIEHVSTSRVYSWYSSYYPSALPLVNYRVDQSGNLGVYNPDATHINDIGLNNYSLYSINKNVFTGPLGLMVNFTNSKNHCLSFNFKEGDIDVLYAGTVLDEDKYPMMPEKSLEAVAYYMNYIAIRMAFNMKQSTGDQLQLAKKEMEQAIAAAKSPEWLSNNEYNSILDVMTTHNRKRYNLQHRSR